jgi:NDP-sugar pyrophosphorylase family protein
MPTTAPLDPWSDVTAVILAGGVGSRLKSVVSDRPKGLAEVNGRPFLAFLLDQLVAAGARRAVFSTGYLAAQIDEAFGDDFHGMRIGYSHETTALGTGGGLRLAADTLASSTLLVLNGDSYCEVDLTAFLADALRGRSPALVLSQQADTSRFGRVEHGPDGRIDSFREKGDSPGAGWINAGIYALPRELVLAIPTGRPVSLEREVFPAWIGRGLRAFPSKGRFLDIGTPESYREASDFFRTIPPFRTA